ncbi:hypothetical protein E2I00_006280 [Balaenoptera physalus]|uniref:C2H2-type domain-containing protein n=1 Tax=Balaenoptera physalus TaxID=9770 RepID=A0A6A1PX88_BALPH|nr:hypothetical protein E2I00_006280 [Balaenoptera physalus]
MAESRGMAEGALQASKKCLTVAEAWNWVLLGVSVTPYSCLSDDGLPKPELISWLEQGRELFRNWGESQKSGNIICSSADLHLDPVIEGQLFGECGRGFRRKSCLLRPLAIYPEESQLAGSEHFRCPECGRGFHRKSCLLRPLAIHREGSQLAGSECEMYAHHLRTGPRPSQCPGCDERGPRGPPSAERPGSRREGARAASEQAELLRSGEKPGLSPAGEERPESLEPGPGAERPASCGPCSRRSSPQCGLPDHTHVHSAERPFRCTDGERPFGCPECGKSFRLKGILKAHERTHSRERPFQCAECGKGFTRPSKLAEHFRVHSGERPFGCPDCGRRFRLKGQLRSHQRLHTGERPFPCPDCGKSYRRIHRPDRPFACADCGKGFIYKSKLAEHIRVHTKSCRAPSEPDVKQRLSQLFAMIEADWS